MAGNFMGCEALPSRAPHERKTPNQQSSLRLLRTKMSQQKKKKGPSRPGSGGAWRAFLHSRTRGAKWAPETVSQLSQEYKQLDPQDKLLYEEMGDAATVSQSIGGPSFPACSRRARQNRKGLAPKPSTSELPELPNPEHEELLSSIQEGDSVDFPVHVAATKYDTGARGMDLAKAQFDTVVRVLSRGARVKRRVIKEVEQQMDTETMLDSVQSAQKMLASRRRLESIPMCNWRALSSSMPAMSAVFDAQRCPEVHKASTASTATDSAARLAQAWDDQHRGVFQSSCRARERRAPRQVCLNAGLCTCQGDGRLYTRMKQRLSDHLKNLSLDATFAASLQNGEVILRWCASDPMENVMVEGYGLEIGGLQLRQYQAMPNRGDGFVSKSFSFRLASSSVKTLLSLSFDSGGFLGGTKPRETRLFRDREVFRMCFFFSARPRVDRLRASNSRALHTHCVGYIEAMASHLPGSAPS